MLSSGMKCYHLGWNVIIWNAILSSGANVIIWDKMLSSKANVIMVSSGANVIIWCYHVMLSSGIRTPPFLFFLETSLTRIITVLVALISISNDISLIIGAFIVILRIVACHRYKSLSLVKSVSWPHAYSSPLSSYHNQRRSNCREIYSWNQSSQRGASGQDMQQWGPSSRWLCIMLQS